MSQGAIRTVAAVVAFIIAAAAGVLLFGNFGAGVDPVTFINKTGADSLALILAIAGVVAFVVYGGVEYAQTGSVGSISRQFDTRTIVLMPVAIALNIIMGQAVGNALKIPIYLDSIGTILVGALAGPIPGAITGLLANLIWAYVLPPPFQSPAVGAFAIVAAVIGLMAGAFGRYGWLRPRPNRNVGQLAIGAVVAVGLILLLTWVAYEGYKIILGETNLTPTSDNALFLILGYLALALVVGTVVGLLLLLFVRRDLTAAYVVVAGVVTGIVAALISAPISANVFGGVTGAGTDFLVAALRQAGADVQAATLGQGLISDPIDKVVTFFVVYLILSAMAIRSKARFPQGERLVERADVEGAPA